MKPQLRTIRGEIRTVAATDVDRVKIEDRIVSWDT